MSEGKKRKRNSNSTTKKKKKKHSIKTDRDRLSRYFSDYHEGSIAGYSALDLKILHIRSQIDSWLCKNQFTMIEGLLVGLLYSDRQFASQVVEWPSKWNQDENSLLDAIIGAKDDPPKSLLQLIVDLAPSVITQMDVSGSLPLHRAICDIVGSTFGKGKKGKSLETVKFLIEADKSKSSWNCRATFTPLENSAFREDEGIARYLLSFPEIRKELTENIGRGPLYYVSRDLIKAKDSDYEPIHPWIKFWLMETAKAMTNSTPSSISECIDICRDKVYDEQLLRKRCLNE